VHGPVPSVVPASYLQAVEIEYGPRCQLARVTFITDQGHSIQLEFPNGLTGNASGSEPFAVEVGDVVFVETDRIELAPPELWPEEQWVGVVRLRLGDESLIDISGRLHLIAGSKEVSSFGILGG